MNRSRFAETVVRFAQCTDKTKILLPETKELVLASIARGILFVYAGWSGPSVRAWKALTQALNDEHSFEFKFYVIDADELSAEFVDQQLNVLPQGNGETFWILGGRILQTRSRYGDEHAQEIRDLTKAVFVERT